MTNFTGFLNPVTIKQYPAWDPNNWDVTSIKYMIFETLDYGLGTILFNFQSSDNILNITLQNVKFQWIYSKL